MPCLLRRQGSVAPSYWLVFGFFRLPFLCLLIFYISWSFLYPGLQYLRSTLWPRNDYPNRVSLLICETCWKFEWLFFLSTSQHIPKLILSGRWEPANEHDQVVHLTPLLHRPVARRMPWCMFQLWIYRLKKPPCPDGWCQPIRTEIPMVPERNPAKKISG